MAATSVLQIILPKKRPNPKGTGLTPTYNAQNPSVALTAPSYAEHRTDIFDSRASDDSRTLLRELFKQDPDVSAAVSAYITVASAAEPWYVVYDETGAIDREGQKQLDIILQSMFGKNDYSLGFDLKPGLKSICNELRYLALLRGVLGEEVIIDQNYMPVGIRHIDMATVEWTEKQPGILLPEQVPAGSDKRINLSIPNFFVQFYKRDPLGLYAHSPFVSSINTIAARQQVVNDLYRIMRQTGYPRQSIKVVEEVLRKNAPADIRTDEAQMNDWMRLRLNEIASTVSDLRVDQVYVHTDSIEPGMLNEKTPGMEIDIRPVIETLNAQNQAALKVMGTIIGRGEAGVNTASVESRIFAMHADALNDPIAFLLSDVLTFCLRLNGSTSRVEFGFDKVELRPALELEPQRTMMQNRLLELLQYGVINDDDFHMEMFSRIRPDSAPELAGTPFKAIASVDPAINDGGSALDRSQSSSGGDMARSGASSKKGPPQPSGGN